MPKPGFVGTKAVLPAMLDIMLHAHRMMLFTFLSLCIAWSVMCDDQVFVDIHISVDEPVLSQALAINAWAFGTIPGVSLTNCYFSIA
jgi:hypothetical protein